MGSNDEAWQEEAKQATREGYIWYLIGRNGLRVVVKGGMAGLGAALIIIIATN